MVDDALGTRGWSAHWVFELGEAMATGETGFDDVTFDLVSVQYHALKAGHDYGQYLRDADNANQNEIADFFRSVMEEDSARARKCHDFLVQLGGTDNTAPQS
jgi:bacterioferritin (cytochrome b1)